MVKYVCDKIIIQWLIVCVLVAVAAFCLSTENSYAAVYSEYEPNNVMASADSISVDTGNTFKGTLTNESDVDFIKFTIDKGCHINIDFNGGRPSNTSHSRGINIDIYNANDADNYVAYDTFQYNSNLGYIYGNYDYYLTAGTYYIKLYESGLYERLNYNISFKCTEWENFSEPNNYIGEATSVVNGQYYRGIIDESNSVGLISEDGDQEFFKLNVPSAAYYYVTLKNVDVKDSAVYDFAVATFDSNGNAVKRLNGSYDLIVDQGKSKTICTKLPKGTTYFRVMSDYYPGKYGLCIVKKLPAPKNTYRRLYGHDDVRVSWSAVSGATGYKVYYATYGSSSYNYWGKTTSTSMKVSNLNDGYKYVFKIVPYKTINGYSYNGAYKVTSPIYTLKKVSNLRFAEDGSKVVVKWSGIYGESGYQVYKMKKSNGYYKKVSSYKTANSSIKVSATKNKTYYYKVRAYKKVTVNGETVNVYGPWSSVKAYKR